MSWPPLPRLAGLTLLVPIALLAAGAGVVAPYEAGESFPQLLNAPPTIVRLVDGDGNWRAPFIYRLNRVSQLEQRYEEDRSAPVPLRWLAGGRLVQSSRADAPLLVLGADSFGHDVLSRLLHGARLSLTLALLAAFGAILLGGVAGAIGGYIGGAADELVMRASDLVLVLPAMYVVLALRSVLPLVISPSTVFLLLVLIFAVIGAPFVSRGVRAIVRTERRLGYAVAVTSLGASHFRVLVRHLLPAAAGFVAVQVTMLLPTFIVGEATLSFVGLGFPDTVASWGTMLHEASNPSALADFPWLLSPAAGIFTVVLGLNLLLQGRARGLQDELQIVGDARMAAGSTGVRSRLQ
jgi:peptide/nickel transport system permease protein